MNFREHLAYVHGIDERIAAPSCSQAGKIDIYLGTDVRTFFKVFPLLALKR